MALVKAQCTNCGSTLVLENSAATSAICPHCGTLYLVQQAIQQYNTNNTNYYNNTNYIKNASIINESEFQRLLDAGNGFIKLGDYQSARRTFEELTQKYPQKIDGWLSILRMEIEGRIRNAHDGLQVDSTYNSRALEYAKKLADTQKRKDSINRLLTRYETFAKEHNDRCALLFNSVKEEFSGLKDLYGFKTMMLKGRLGFYSKECDEYGHPWHSLQLVKYACDSYGWQLRADFTEYQNGNATSYNPETCTLEIDGTYCSNLKFLGKNENGEYIVRYEYWELNEKKKKVVDLVAMTDSSLPAHSTRIGGCYIATCIYGSYDCPEVWVLRRFRDNSLASSFIGRLFIKLYYAISPTLVKWFGNTNIFRRFWKSFLDRMVSYLRKKGVEDTKYYD